MSHKVRHIPTGKITTFKKGAKFRNFVNKVSPKIIFTIEEAIESIKKDCSDYEYIERPILMTRELYTSVSTLSIQEYVDLCATLDKVSNRKRQWLKLIEANKMTCPVSGIEVAEVRHDYHEHNKTYHYNFYSACGQLFTVDHIYPKALGGSPMAISNLQPMLYNPNSYKASNAPKLATTLESSNFVTEEDLQDKFAKVLPLRNNPRDNQIIGWISRSTYEAIMEAQGLLANLMGCKSI